MKILFLSRRFYPDIGGVEKHIIEVSRELINKGNRITVLTESQGKINNFKGIEIIRMPKYSDNWLKKFKIWAWFWKSRNLVGQSDLIHAHDVFYWYLPFKFIFLSKKSFITFHGYESYPISKKAIIIRKISEILTDGNIIVGDFIKKWYYTKPDFIIYGGANIPRSHTAPMIKKSALFIGRLDYHTSVMEYSAASDIIKKKFPEFKYEIIGEGEYAKKLKRYKLLGPKLNAVEFLNKFNYAFVSRYLSILEALAHKRLVFALYDNPVKEDYLKMASFAKFIVIENSAENLAEKVLYHIKNPNESEKLVENGYGWVENQTWEKIANTYLKLWKQKK